MTPSGAKASKGGRSRAGSKGARSGLRERQRDFTTAHILRVGLELFSSKGYSQVTVDEIVERCGCARGTFYSYFPNGKDELFRAIYRQIGEEFDARFADAEGEVGDDIVGLVTRAAGILMDISSEPGKGRFFMIEAPALGHVLGDTLGRTSRGIVAALSTKIEAAQAAGWINPDVSAEELSRLLMGLLRAVAIQVADGTASRDEVLRALEVLVTGQLSTAGVGLRKKAAGR